jgi:TfoX/Sxy family transcriptional regulator of competence genes
MAYSESLAGRIRDAVRRVQGVDEKKMFGGVGFLLHGNMLVGVWKDSLIARVGAEAYEAALAEPHVCEFDITGRPIKGWVMVEPDGVDSDRQLADWVERTLRFVRTLPGK